jgi:ankyrin repeat protein
VRTFDEDITPLVLRARDAVLLCLGAGLDVKAANENGQTALFGAVYLGSPALVQLLVDRGAPINVPSPRKANIEPARSS